MTRDGVPVERGIWSRQRKRLRRTHWLPEKTTMNNLVYATARRKNLGRARPVSEIPATGQLPGRRDMRRVGRPVVKQKSTRPAAPADPHAHFERVGHELAGPHSHHIRVVRTSGRPAFSLRTCTPPRTLTRCDGMPCIIVFFSLDHARETQNYA